MGNKKVKKTLYIEGMTCTSCENRIETSLNKAGGIQYVKANYVNASCYIEYDENIITLENIIKIIEKMDYQVKTGIPAKKSYGWLIVTVIILLGGYLIINNTVGFNFIPEITPNMGYGILFVIGLLTSIHCIAMCGGINLSVCVSKKVENAQESNYKKLMPSIMYNLGRVVSYTIIGGIVGAIGSVFSLSNAGSAFIAILAGVFMIIMGLNMLNIFPWLKKLNIHMPKALVGKLRGKNRNQGPFLVGLLNGLMPCGPLQAMQIYALGTGSFIAGALSMFAFSIGTVPLLFIFGALGSLLSSKFTKNMIKVSAVLVIVLGGIMLTRGFAFTGISASTITSNSTKTTDEVAEINGDVQELTTNLESNNYPTLTVQAGVPVKWTIIASEENLNGCNGEIVIPEYDVEKKLQVGENVIEFTPAESGSFGYSCWMGMIRSSITVAEDISSLDGVQNLTPTTEDVNTEDLPSCCDS